MRGAFKRLGVAAAACALAMGVAGGAQIAIATSSGGDNSSLDETTRNSYTVQTFNETTFGTYEQDGNTSNGAEPIEWLVLGEQDSKTLLISKYVLDAQPYAAPVKGQPRWPEGSPRPTVVTEWADSALRTWLNGEFMDTAFNADEKSAIATTLNTDTRNNATHTAATAADPSIHVAKESQDSVFVLSRMEAWKYFTSNAARVAFPTEYALSKGVFTGIATDEHGQIDEERSGAAFWWLRSQGYYAGYEAVVIDDGYVHGDGYRADGDVHDGFKDHGSNASALGGNFGVRPCIWVDSSALA